MAIFVLIPSDQAASDELRKRDLKVIEETSEGTVLEMSPGNRYRGDDETIIYSLSYDPRLDGIEGWKVLWDRSDY